MVTEANGDAWNGGSNKPLNASYGKMMMWFFILSDALTFSGFLVAYGFMRFKFIDSWPIADQVFTHFPFLHGVHAPMYYVALMTFILIFSSVTMVLAVDAGHQMNKKKVTFYMLLTIVGGMIFLGSQAWEWKNFIGGSYGAIQLNDGKIIQFVDASGHQVALESFSKSSNTERAQHTKDQGLWFVEEKALEQFTISEVIEGFKAHPEITIRTEKIKSIAEFVRENENGLPCPIINHPKFFLRNGTIRSEDFSNPIYRSLDQLAPAI